SQAVEAGALTRVEMSRSSILKSAIKYAVLPLGAILGSFLAGWATDRFFGNRRAPVICGLLLILGGLTLYYDSVARVSFVGTMVLLGCVGFCVYGPQVLLVGTAPADLARRGTAAAAAGFVNFIGYVGAACGDILTGRLADEHGWQFAIRVWAAWAFMAALLIATLWNARSSEAGDEQQPGPGSGSDREV
ncbi:MAG: MFS transporter, partial [Planctomycetaceae bacterium]